MILLDTHVWFWWLALPDLLSVRARRAIAAATSLGVSPLSCWELGNLVRLGRIALDSDPPSWIRRALAVQGTVIADLHPAAASAAAMLDDRFPPDPIDRMLYATARELRATLVTKDARLRAADPERTLW